MNNLKSQHQHEQSKISTSTWTILNLNINMNNLKSQHQHEHLKSQHQHEQSQISTRVMCCFQFDVDLAKKEANKPEENDDELKKKLWLRIGRMTGCQYFLYWLQWNYFYLLDILFCVFLVHIAIHKLKIPKTKFKLVMMHIIWNPKIQVSMNMSIVIKPWNFVPMKLNAFTVFRIGRIIEIHYCYVHRAVCLIHWMLHFIISIKIDLSQFSPLLTL